MASIREIRKRIVSVQNTQKITKAMKMVAAAKLRRIQGRMIAVRPYAQHIQEMVRRYAGEAVGDEHPLLEQRDVKTTGVLFFSADRGLCGSFSGNLLRKYAGFAAEHRSPGPAVMVAGHKGIAAARKLGHNVLNRYPDIYDKITYPVAAEMARVAVEHFVAGRIDSLHMIYSRFVNPVEQKIVAEKVLPFDVAELAKLNAGPLRNVYYYEPSFEGIAEALLSEYLAAKVYHVLLETACSENAARTAAMDNASENAGEMIDTLTLELNKARQTAITMELLDIVGGSESIRA